MARFVELIRVSTVKQAQKDTPENQRQALDRLRQFRPGTLVERIEAPGISGALSLRDRQDLTRLAELAKAKAFDEIRVFAVDRLTRAEDPRERVAVLGIALDAGAIIVDASGHTINPADDVGELDWYLQSLFAARERKKILERSRAGCRRAALEGRHPQGRLPYGLRYDKAAKRFSWDDAESTTVRRMYELMSAGHSLEAIAKAFDVDGLSTRGGCRWTASRVLEIVRSGHALGVWLHSGISIPVPRLIDDALASRAEASRAKNKKRSGGRIPRHKAILRGILTCAECGSAVRVIVRPTRRRGTTLYYACGAWVSGRKEGHVRISYRRVSDIDSEVVSSIKEALADPGEIEATLRARTRQAPTRAKASEADDSKLASEEDRVLRLLERGVLSEDRAAAKLRELKERRSKVKAELAEAKLQAASRPRPSDVAPSAERILSAIREATPEALAEHVSGLFPGGLRLTASGDVEGDGVLELVSTASESGCNSASRGHAPLRLVSCGTRTQLH